MPARFCRADGLRRRGRDIGVQPWEQAQLARDHWNYSCFGHRDSSADVRRPLNKTRYSLMSSLAAAVWTPSMRQFHADETAHTFRF
jgi:hypothetical protein